MNIPTFLIAFIYDISILFVFPLVFIRLNMFFSLPILSLFILKVLGLTLILLGTVMWLYCIILFYFIGKGTPVPINPPKKLVDSRIYKLSRNPMYISVLIILLGYFFLFGYWLLLLYVSLMSLFFHLFITFYEEPTLKKKFGKHYKEYCKKVSRWL